MGASATDLCPGVPEPVRFFYTHEHSHVQGTTNCKMLMTHFDIYCAGEKIKTINFLSFCLVALNLAKECEEGEKIMGF
jgi:hypothetical protein